MTGKPETIMEAAPESAAPDSSQLTITQLRARIAELEAEVADLENEVAYLEGNVEALEDDETDGAGLLRDIRAEIKRGDTEQALLLIHYELGDY
jgi:chromosome segregation ATPase